MSTNIVNKGYQNRDFLQIQVYLTKFVIW